MEENIVMMNNENENELNEVDPIEEISSGNEMTRSIAFIIAGVVGAATAVFFATRAVVKKISKNKANASDEDDEPVVPAKSKKRGGLPISRNKKIVIIDRRNQEPAEEETDEE